MRDDLLKRGQNFAGNKGHVIASQWVDGQLAFENASYNDQDFMFSSATSNYTDTYYQELLDMVKASGIKGIWNREADV